MNVVKLSADVHILLGITAFILGKHLINVMTVGKLSVRRHLL